MQLRMRQMTLVGLVALGFLGGQWAAKPRSPAPHNAPPNRTAADPRTNDPALEYAAEFSSDQHGQSGIQLPDVRLTPEDVVALQLASLRTTRKDPHSLRQCYALASPRNRGATGPLSRFTEMIAQPPFDALLDQEAWLIGRAVVHGKNAILAATVVGTDRNVTTFRFLLSRQSTAPFTECWMTDGVWRDEPQSPASSSPPPVPAA